MTSSRKRLTAALAFVLPVAAFVAAPAFAQTHATKPKTHTSSVHKTSAHKSSHKTTHKSTPTS